MSSDDVTQLPSRQPNSAAARPGKRSTAHHGACTSSDSPKNHPMVTILIPTYNRAHWLRQCVESALAQGYPNLEVLVVDDGSTDHTTQIMQRFSDRRLRYIRKKHTNAPHTRNHGILHAQGEFILWLDSDDILLPHVVQKEMAVFDQFPQADVVHGDMENIDEHGRETGEVHRVGDYWGVDFLSCVIWGSRVLHGGTMVRKSLYEQHGLYNERFLRAHDYELWSRVAESAKFKHAGCVVCKRRIHDSQLSGDLRRDNIDMSYDIEILQGLVKRYPLRRLFPAFFQNGPDWAISRSYLALATILVRRKDPRKAHAYFRKCLSHLDNVHRRAHEPFLNELDRFLYRSYITRSPYCRAEALAAVCRFPSSFSFWRRLLMTATPSTLRMRLKKLKETTLDRQKVGGGLANILRSRTLTP